MPHASYKVGPSGFGRRLQSDDCPSSLDSSALRPLLCLELPSVGHGKGAAHDMVLSRLGYPP